MIRDIKEYNQKTYDDYLKAKNYTGLADYLDSFDIDDEELRNEVHSTIIQLREQGRIRDAMMSKAGTNKDAVNFTENIISGNFSNDNVYGRRFNRRINRIGSKDNREASELEIEFKNIDDYNSFVKNIGLSENELSENNIKFNSKDGVNSIRFNKQNPLISSILSSINFDGNYRPVNTNDALLEFNDIRGLNTQYKRQYNINVKSYDNKGLIDNNVDPVSLLRLRNFKDRISNKAIEAFDDVMSNPEVTSRTTTTILTGFTSAGRTQLQYDFDHGKINRETYNALKDDIEKHDYALLDGVSLLNSDEVYVKTPKSKTAELTIEHDPEELDRLTTLLHQALDEGRVRMQAALVGNKTGTYLTIHATKADKYNTADETSSGKRTGETVIFVPNLLQGECEDAFNRDTKTRATKEKWNLQTYEYPYYFDDGSSIRYIYQQNPNTGDTKQIGLYKDKGGNEIPISDEEVINKLNRQFIEDEGTYNLYYQRKMSDFYKTHKREDFDSLKEANPDILEYCKKAMEELFPGVNTQSEQYEYELQKLFDDIYNKLKNYKL